MDDLITVLIDSSKSCEINECISVIKKNLNAEISDNLYIRTFFKNVSSKLINNYLTICKELDIYSELTDLTPIVNEFIRLSAIKFEIFELYKTYEKELMNIPLLNILDSLSSLIYDEIDKVLESYIFHEE